jgi:hypothetical protein
LHDDLATRRPEKHGIRAIEDSLGTIQAELLRANAALEDALKTKARADAEQEIQAQALQSSPAQSDLEQRLLRLTTKTSEAGDALRAA